MLYYDHLDIFGKHYAKQITNAPQIANKHNVTLFVYKPNYKNIDVL